MTREPKPDDPITLEEACDLAFRGTITIASLFLWPYRAYIMARVSEGFRESKRTTGHGIES